MKRISLGVVEHDMLNFKMIAKNRNREIIYKLIFLQYWSENIISAVLKHFFYIFKKINQKCLYCFYLFI